MAKVYEVIKATKAPFDGLAVKHKGKIKHMRFNKWGALLTKDKSLAHDLEQQHGYKNGAGSVVVAEVDQQVSSDTLHKYFFTNPGLPWAKYDNLGRRLPDDNETDNESIKRDREPSTKDVSPGNGPVLPRGRDAVPGAGH